MRTLRVRYREDDGSVSERILSGFLPDGVAFLVSSQDDTAGATAQRLSFDQVLEAVDVETGELIDVRELCGGPPCPGPVVTPAVRQSRPRLRARGSDGGESNVQRRDDREQFLARFGREVVWNHFRNRLIGLFNGRCFACDSPFGLQFDHHVPFVRGGRREPGNIVVLCDRCNARKRDSPPSEFYSKEELAHLAPLLERQKEMLTFDFNEEHWNESPVDYLREIGVSPLLVHEITTNPDHDWYVRIDGKTGRAMSLLEDPEFLAQIDPELRAKMGPITIEVTPLLKEVAKKYRDHR